MSQALATGRGQRLLDALTAHLRAGLVPGVDERATDRLALARQLLATGPLSTSEGQFVAETVRAHAPQLAHLLEAA